MVQAKACEVGKDSTNLKKLTRLSTASSLAEAWHEIGQVPPIPLQQELSASDRK
jgi:hypothetical protein